MDQLLQVLGAVLILLAYVAAQANLLSQRSVPYLILNVLGSSLLGVLAAQQRQLGFLLLESVWALVSLWSLVGQLRSHPSTGDQGGPS